MFNRNSKKNTRFAIYAGNPGFSGMVIIESQKTRRLACGMNGSYF